MKLEICEQIIALFAKVDEIIAILDRMSRPHTLVFRDDPSINKETVSQELFDQLSEERANIGFAIFGLSLLNDNIPKLNEEMLNEHYKRDVDDFRVKMLKCVDEGYITKDQMYEIDARLSKMKKPMNKMSRDELFYHISASTSNLQN